MALLVLHAALASSRAVLLQHLRSLAAHLGEPIVYHHLNAPVDEDMRRCPWRAIVLNYDFLQVRQSLWRELLLEKYDFVADSNCCKIAITMDDPFMCGILEDIILRFGCTHIFTPLYAFVHLLYPRLMGRVVFHEMLTGYVDKALAAEWMTKALPHAARPIDVGTRVRRVPASHGRFGLEKADYAERFAEIVSLRHMTTDISTRDADVISGVGWYEFLGRCRASVAMKGGYGLVDPDGSCRARHDAFVAQNPRATYDDIRAACFPNVDDNLRIAVESPRLFECAMTFTTQIMPREPYIGGLEPWTHYIPLETDLAGIDDALAALADYKLCNAIARRCHEALIQSDDFTTERFASHIAHIIKCSSSARAPLSSTQRSAVPPAGRAAKMVESWRRTTFPFVSRALGYLLLFHPRGDLLETAQGVFTQAADSAAPILVSTLYQDPLHRFIHVPALLSLSAMANIVQCLNAGLLWRSAIQQLASEEIDAFALLPWDYSGSVPEVMQSPNTNPDHIAYLLDAGLFDQAEAALFEERSEACAECWLQVALLRLARGHIDTGLDALLRVVASGERDDGNYIEAALASIIVLAIPMGLNEIAAVAADRLMPETNGSPHRFIREFEIFAPHLLDEAGRGPNRITGSL